MRKRGGRRGGGGSITPIISLVIFPTILKRKIYDMRKINNKRDHIFQYRVLCFNYHLWLILIWFLTDVNTRPFIIHVWILSIKFISNWPSSFREDCNVKVYTWQGKRRIENDVNTSHDPFVWLEKKIIGRRDLWAIINPFLSWSL